MTENLRQKDIEFDENSAAEKALNAASAAAAATSEAIGSSPVAPRQSVKSPPSSSVKVDGREILQVRKHLNDE